MARYGASQQPVADAAPPPTAGAPMPDIVGRPAGGKPRSKHKPEAPFYYRWRPNRWQVMLGHVVPLLSKLVLSGGSNGCDAEAKTGRPIVELAVAQSAAKGWNIIPWDVDGPGTNYITPDDHGGWITRFERVIPGHIKTATDTPAFVAWMRSLVLRGKIDPPEDWALGELEDDYVTWMRRCRKNKDDGGVELYQAMVKVVRAERERLGALAEPLPVVEGTPALGSGMSEATATEIRARYTAGGIFKKDLAKEYGITMDEVNRTLDDDG